MSIAKIYDKHVPICDICGEDLPPEHDFYDAVASSRQADWIKRKRDGEWIDICRECQT